MKRKTSKSKPREITLSSTELSKFGMRVMNRALKVVDSAKKGKITIKLGGRVNIIICRFRGQFPSFIQYVN